MNKRFLTLLSAVIATALPLSFGRTVAADDRGPAIPTPTPSVSRPRVLVTSPTPLGTPTRVPDVTPAAEETPNLTGTPRPTPTTASMPTLVDLQSAIRQRTFD